LLRRENIAPWFFDWLAHPTRDEYWERWSIERRHANVAVPALHVAGWYDIFLEGSLRNYCGLRAHAASERARQGQRLLVGPWIHTPWTRFVCGWDFGAEAASGIDRPQLRWFDHWLKGIDSGLLAEPPVRVFVMGECRWRTSSAWPLPEAEAVE